MNMDRSSDHLNPERVIFEFILRSEANLNTLSDLHYCSGETAEIVRSRFFFFHGMVIFSSFYNCGKSCVP